MYNKSTLMASAALATIFGLATAEFVMADKPLDGECRGNSCGDNGFDNSIVYHVDLEDDPNFVSTAPLFDTTCETAHTNGDSVNIYFPAHDLCASFLTSTGTVINDNVHILVDTDNRNRILSIQVFGQNRLTGVEIMHRSDVILLSSPVTPSKDVPFTLEINQDPIPIYNCKHALQCKKKTDALEYAGNIAVEHMVYSPKEP